MCLLSELKFSYRKDSKGWFMISVKPFNLPLANLTKQIKFLHIIGHNDRKTLTEHIQ